MEFHWAENLDEDFKLLVLELGESRSLITMGDILYLIHTVLLSVFNSGSGSQLQVP